MRVDDMLERLAAFVADAAVRALALRASGLVIDHKGADLAQAVTQADTAISAMMQASFAPRLVEEETAAMSREPSRPLDRGRDTATAARLAKAIRRAS